MELHYLDFDFSDDDSGRGSFDAMAVVAAARLPSLLAEVSTVLHWAQRSFGPAGADAEDGGGWDFDLQAQAEPGGEPLPLRPGPGAGDWQPVAGHPVPARCQLTLTLSGPAAFCEAFREAFRAAG